MTENPLSKSRIFFIIINFIACFICFFDFGCFVGTSKNIFAWVMFILGILNAFAVLEWAIEAFIYEFSKKQKQ